MSPLPPGAHVSVSHPQPGGRSRAHRQGGKVSRTKVYNLRSNNSRSSHAPFKRVASPATVVDQ